jgi:hypothetical protein
MHLKQEWAKQRVGDDPRIRRHEHPSMQESLKLSHPEDIKQMAQPPSGRNHAQRKGLTNDVPATGRAQQNKTGEQKFINIQSPYACPKPQRWNEKHKNLGKGAAQNILQMKESKPDDNVLKRFNIQHQQQWSQSLMTKIQGCNQHQQWWSQRDSQTLLHQIANLVSIFDSSLWKPCVAHTPCLETTPGYLEDLWKDSEEVCRCSCMTRWDNLKPISINPTNGWIYITLGLDLQGRNAAGWNPSMKTKKTDTRKIIFCHSIHLFSHAMHSLLSQNMGRFSFINHSSPFARSKTVGPSSCSLYSKAILISKKRESLQWRTSNKWHNHHRGETMHRERGRPTDVPATGRAQQNKTGEQKFINIQSPYACPKPQRW